MHYNIFEATNVFYQRFFSIREDVPLVKLEFGTNPVVEANIVGEGADVYFECNIRANPTVYRVAWKHNVSLKQNTFYEFA